MYARTLKFAGIQARLRARIGLHPDARAFASAAQAGSADRLDGLSGIGAGFWIEGLSPSVSADGLERHFNGRVRHLMRQVAGWLPREWSGFGKRLVLAPDVFWIAPVLRGHEPGTRLDRDSLMHGVLRAPLARRLEILAQSPLGELVDAAEAPEIRWRRVLRASVPDLPAAERRPVERLLRCLDEYLHDKSALLPAGDPAAGETVPASPAGPGEWREQRALEQRLRLLLAGDPFHPAVILVYALLELLTMEKVRALLLSRLLGWPPPRALTRVA